MLYKDIQSKATKVTDITEPQETKLKSVVKKVTKQVSWTGQQERNSVQNVNNRGSRPRKRSSPSVHSLPYSLEIYVRGRRGKEDFHREQPGGQQWTGCTVQKSNSAPQVGTLLPSRGRNIDNVHPAEFQVQLINQHLYFPVFLETILTTLAPPDSSTEGT